MLEGMKMGVGAEGAVEDQDQEEGVGVGEVIRRGVVGLRICRLCFAL